MIKDFFIKKENIFIFLIAFISIFFIVLGFLFLFFKTDSSSGPRVIPTDVSEIVWDKFNSKLLDQKIQYPQYLYVREQADDLNASLNITEFESDNFLDYFSNQSHISIYPSGIDIPLIYGKTVESEYTSESNQKYKKIEYITIENEIWAVMFIPVFPYEKWESKGFIWIQSKIQNLEQKCITETSEIMGTSSCDIYRGQKVIYSGKTSDQFLKTGYEIINKNYFK